MKSYQNFQSNSNLLGSVSTNPLQQHYHVKDPIAQLQNLQQIQRKALEQLQRQTALALQKSPRKSAAKGPKKPPIISSSEVIPECEVSEESSSPTPETETMTNHSVKSDDSRDHYNGAERGEVHKKSPTSNSSKSSQSPSLDGVKGVNNKTDIVSMKKDNSTKSSNDKGGKLLIAVPSFPVFVGQ